jgi:hypothetical protein
MIDFFIAFFLGMIALEVGFFLWWRLYIANLPCRTQHIDDNRRIDDPSDHEAMGAMLHTMKKRDSE